MKYAVPNETFSIVMECGEGVKFIKGKEYEYKRLTDCFIVKGENGAVKLSPDETTELFTRKIYAE